MPPSTQDASFWIDKMVFYTLKSEQATKALRDQHGSPYPVWLNQKWEERRLKWHIENPSLMFSPNNMGTLQEQLGLCDQFVNTTPTAPDQ